MEEEEQVNDPILAQLNSAPQKEEDDPILAQLNQESGGGASMGFTEGSQEPQEQPSQPSEESGAKPSVLVEQRLPVGVASREELISNIKDPYIKRQEEILLSASNEKKKLISELPIQQERQKLLDGYQPLLQQKQQELQQSLSRGEITEEEANNQLNSYYEKANQQINQRLEKNSKLNDELRKVNDEVNEKAFRELNAVMKDKQAAIDLAYQEQIDQLSPLESMGNALFNSALMTSTIPAKTVLLGEQLAENFTVDLPIALYGLISGEEISDETKQAVRGETQSVTQQQSAYKEIKDTEEQLKPTLPFIESLEKGQIDKASAAAVGTSIDFLRSIITGAGTLGTGTFGEIGAPMYMDAVRAKAKETGKKEEDIIAEDLEDETTALLSAGLATAAEYYGLGTATKFMKNAVFKQGVKDQVKKNLPKLVELGKDVSVASLKESGTEVFQQSIEEANKAALDNGGIGTDEGRKAFLKEGINSTFTKQAAETGASTFAGSMLLFGMGKGAGSLRRTKSVIDTPTQLLSDEDIKQVLDNKDNIEVLSEQIKGMYQAGVITEEEYKVSEDKINTVLRYDSELSPTNTNREEGIRLLAKREQLENEMESLHPTQRGNIETKIAKIDEQLINIVNGTGQAPQEDKGRTVRDRAQEEGDTDKVNKLFDSRVKIATEKFDKAINDVIKESSLPYYEANELKRVTELRAEKDKTISDLESKRSKALKTKLKGAVKKTSVQNDKDVDSLDDLGISDEELLELEDEIGFEEKTSQAPEVLEQGMVSDGGKNYEITSIDNKKDGSKVVKAKEVIEVTEDNIEDLQSSRKAPLKIGDTVYGTTKRYIGDVAEQIAKDNAVGVFEEKAPKPPKWKTRGTSKKQEVTPTPKTFSSKAKPTIEERTEEDIEKELEEGIKSIEKDQKDFEQAILDELAAKNRNRD